MTERDHARALAILGVRAGADRAHIIAAHRRRRSLYGADNLATYNLLGEEERQQLLRDMDWALQVLTEAEVPERPEPPPPAAPPRPPAAPRPSAPEGPEPDRVTEPGAHLSYHRRLQGLSLEELAAETKISKSLIASLEAEESSKLPAPVFVRGFVIALTDALGLAEPEELARAFLKKLNQKP